MPMHWTPIILLILPMMYVPWDSNQKQNKHISRNMANHSCTTHISKRVRMNNLCVIVMASKDIKLMIRIAKPGMCTVRHATNWVISLRCVGLPWISSMQMTHQNKCTQMNQYMMVTLGALVVHLYRFSPILSQISSAECRLMELHFKWSSILARQYDVCLLTL